MCGYILYHQKKFCASKTEPSLARARAWFGSSSSALQSWATSQQLLIEEEHVMASLEPKFFFNQNFVAGAVLGEVQGSLFRRRCSIW